MLSVVLLMAVGLIFIYSVSGPYSQSQGLSEWYYFIRQTIWTVLAVTTLFVTSLIDYHKLLKLSPFFVAISLGLLVAVLFAPAKQHVHRWLEFGPVQLQPSEVFKVSLIMFLAFSLAKEKARFSNKKKIFMKIIIIMVGMVLVARQPDFGTLTVIFSVTFALLFLVGVKARYLLGGTAAIAIMGSIIVFGIGYEKDRITDYFAILNNPLADINTPGTHGGFYQVRQSLISIGSGGLIGRVWVPEAKKSVPAGASYRLCVFVIFRGRRFDFGRFYFDNVSVIYMGLPESRPNGWGFGRIPARFGNGDADCHTGGDKYRSRHRHPAGYGDYLAIF
jgi:cell division protein FtsW